MAGKFGAFSVLLAGTWFEQQSGPMQKALKPLAFDLSSKRKIAKILNMLSRESEILLWNNYISKLFGKEQ